jgi:hypothetical protein
MQRGVVIAIAVAIIGLSVGGLVGLATHDNGGTKVASRESATTTSTSTAEETTTTATPSSTAFTALGTNTTKATTKATTTTAPRSAAVHAPQAGTYTYVETDKAGNDAPKTHSFTEKITVDPDEGGRNRRTVETSNGGGTDEQAWGTDNVYSLRASGQFGCAWQPPRLLYPGTLRTGQTWSYTSTCYNQPTDQLTKEEASFQVSSVEADKTWIIHVTKKTTLTYSKTGQVLQEVNLDGYIRVDPNRGLIVQQHDTYTSKETPTAVTQDIHLS